MIELDQLVRFVQHPVRAFLRQRLGIAGSAQDDDVDDALSLELNALERWGLGERMLDALVAGADREASIAAEIARGELPPELLAESVLAEVYPVVEQLVAVAADYVSAAEVSASLDVRVELPGGRVLAGTVPGVRGDLVAALTYSRLAPKHRLNAWVYLLALAASRPATAYEAVTLGRRRADGPRGHEVTLARIRLSTDSEVRQAEALRDLAVVVDLFERGMREPLPLYCKTSAAYAAAVAAGKDGRAAAGKEWATSWNYPKEDAEPEHVLVLGGTRTIAELFEDVPRDDEQGDGWAIDESSRVGRYARRLWDGLRAREELIDR
jgi:exodeoxyribonuclease V gamma subunit